MNKSIGDALQTIVSNINALEVNLNQLTAINGQLNSQLNHLADENETLRVTIAALRKESGYHGDE